MSRLIDENKAKKTLSEISEDDDGNAVVDYQNIVYYPELRDMIYLLLFQGQTIAYNADDMATDLQFMFGFLKVEHETIRIANRIFETRLYNYFLTLPEVQNGDMYKLALRNKN